MKNAAEFAYYDQLHKEKYRDGNQDYENHSRKLAKSLSSNDIHNQVLYNGIINQRIIPAGRVQAALGASEREVSPFNCAVSQTIEDSMESIMAACTKAALILRLGTGIGYNFSKLRPRGAEIKKTKTESSGPLSFMKIFNVMAETIASSGHRRGAQMGIMNVDHPDIEAFIDAKMTADAYRQFNLSVGVTDAFMTAVKADYSWNLHFDATVYKTVSARYLWDKILKNAYESAEPGIIFIDRLNQSNNLWYCEDIDCTNPCAEQPLPPNGLCLLGSLNLAKYLNDRHQFDYIGYRRDIAAFVRGYNNIFEPSVYAVPEHREEALNKRRMGLGLTGVATAVEMMRNSPCYGDENFCFTLEYICSTLTNTAYETSIEMAKEKGSFPLFERDKYLESEFVKTLPGYIQDGIYKHGIYNSHLVSYAPCGTISQVAQNVSSGIEPIFYHSVDRKVHMKSGLKTITINDYNYREYGFKGKTLEECSVDDHMNVVKVVQKYTDSAISKTVNVATGCTYDEYATIYMNAFDSGLKGITVYRPTELRGAVITKSEKPIEEVYNCPSGVCAL